MLLGHNRLKTDIMQHVKLLMHGMWRSFFLHEILLMKRFFCVKTSKRAENGF